MYGRESGDWGVHDIGHTISVLYDTAHGATLSIAYPAWLKLHKDKIPERITELGKNLFGVDSVQIKQSPGLKIISDRSAAL